MSCPIVDGAGTPSIWIRHAIVPGGNLKSQLTLNGSPRRAVSIAALLHVKDLD